MEIDFSHQNLEKNIRISNLVKIRPLEAEMYHADVRKDRQTKMIKLNVAFRNFSTSPGNNF
jgi:hypothetical protein